jgi:hypothetical protein
MYSGWGEGWEEDKVREAATPTSPPKVFFLDETLTHNQQQKINVIDPTPSNV